MGYGMDECWGTCAAEDERLDAEAEEKERRLERLGLTEAMQCCHHPFFKGGVCVLCGASRKLAALQGEI